MTDPYVSRPFFFFQAEDGIRDYKVTGVQTCALPICRKRGRERTAFVRQRFGTRICRKEKARDGSKRLRSGEMMQRECLSRQCSTGGQVAGRRGGLTCGSAKTTLETE